jgi:FKBP-type peptidyl-prolyl cis-trans isomerase 2
MKDGDFIRIDYVGRISESREIFDLTKGNVAKKEGIFNPNVKYNPVPVVIGGNFVVRGLENELKKMKVGDKKKISVDPTGAFGERKSEFIKLIPLSEFKKQDMDPYPGMPVTINKLMGRVLSVSGGRVRIDFNHPLAGKTLEYEVEVKKKITKKPEKVKAILEFFFKDGDDIEADFKQDTVEIKIKKDITRRTKRAIAENIIKWVNFIKKVRFIDEFTQ